jgi:hypothetical protein
MNGRRLPWLVALIAGLLVLRWWSPPASDASTAVSEAVTHRTGTQVPPPPTAAPGETKLAHSNARDLDTDEPRNAFAVRTPPPPPAPPPAPPPPRVAAVVTPVVVAAPIVDPAPPPPPLQVIGTWDDGGGASVFMAGPRSTLQGRVGDVLLTEYRVTQITPQQVVLRHLSSNRDVYLTVPSASGRSLK